MSPSIPAAVELAIYLMDLVKRRQGGELTDEQFEAAMDALQVQRNDTSGIWEDAKAAGGYT